MDAARLYHHGQLDPLPQRRSRAGHLQKEAFDILYGTARARLVNLSEQLDTDTAALSAQIARGITTLGELVQRQIASD